MGQSPSSNSKGHRRRSFRSLVRRSKRNKSSLSHTFSLPQTEEYSELMNVNTATEEQLMTLPGVTRQLARDIVRHRNLIGRFKRVDDLALVSGVGAEKLEALRPEICTNTKKGLSRTSSCTQSLDSIRLSDSRLCSVNSASVFQLQCVPGLNQELAANIVDYRNKKGPFKSLDDLIKVRGIDIVRLSNVKPHLSLESRKCESVQHLNSTLSNGWSTGLPLNGSLVNGLTSPRTPHRKSLSMPTKFPIILPNGFATAPVNDILDLLSAYSHRPIIEEDFKYERDGVRCCRLASWNLHQLNIDKVTNPGVKEVVCRTILENKLSLIAIQDVYDEAALRVLCDELNTPTLRRIREWKSNSQRWQYCAPDREDRKLGFIYESSNKSITIEEVALERIIEKNQGLIEELNELSNLGVSYTMCTQAFLVCGRPLLAINVSCDGFLSDVERAALRDALAAAAGRCRLRVAIFGDFGASENVQLLEEIGEALIGESIHTTTDVTLHGRSDIFTSKATACNGFNGTSGAIRMGLSHLAIPRGWSWGGPVSPHCPVWAEYMVED